MFPPEKHGAISPSRLQRIVDCPGSFKLTRDKTQKSSVYADEGTMLHGVVEQCINSGQRPIVQDIPEPWVGQGLDDEYLVAVNDCLDYYYNTLKTVPGSQVFTERQVYLKEYHSCLLECYGTCDIIIVNENEIHVIDWKFGKGVPVYAKDNDQLYAYLTGAALEFGHIDQFPNMYVHCIQPRLNSFDSHVITPPELYQWLNSRIVPGVTRAQSNDAPFNPGTAQCRWCPAKVGCRARHNFANQVAADVFSAHLNLQTEEVPILELAEALKKAEAYETYIKDLRTYAQRTLEAGKDFPGWKIVQGRSNRRWINEEVATDWMVKNSDGDYDRLFQTKLISPSAAERKFRHWKKEQDFHDLVEKPPGKHKLAVETDPRPAVEFKTASEKFEEALNENVQ